MPPWLPGGLWGSSGMKIWECMVHVTGDLVPCWRGRTKCRRDSDVNGFSRAGFEGRVEVLSKCFLL